MVSNKITAWLLALTLGSVAIAGAMPQAPDERIRRAIELIELDRLVEAREVLDAAAAAGGDVPTIRYHLARVCYRAGNVDAALERLEAVSELAPHWRAPKLLGADIALEADDPAMAAGFYRATLDNEAGDADLWIRYGDALFEAAHFDYEGPREAYESALAADPESDLAWVALTYFQFNRRRFEDTRVSLDEFLRRAPGNPYALFLSAQMQALDGDDEGALAALDKALDELESFTSGIDDAAPPAWFRIDLLELQARMLMNLGRLSEAERAARDVLASEPLNRRGFFLLGTTLVRAERPEGRDYLASYVLLQEWRTHKDLGYFHRVDGQLARAAEEFETALRIKPNDSEVLTELGAVRLALGENAAAIEALRRARTFGAVGPSWYRHWVLALNASGRTDEARQVWLQARAQGARLGPEVWAALGGHDGACGVEGSRDPLIPALLGWFDE